LVITPGVRADIDIKLWPIKETLSVKPLWLKALAIKLGTLSLGAHDGTKTSYTRNPGLKSRALRPDQLANPNVPAGKNVKQATLPTGTQK
jgi:hypothetical protein